MDREKVLQGWERCKICDTSFFATDDARKAYVECEYTTGLYCRRDKLINETIALLKEHEEVVRCKDCEHWGEYECHITNLTGQKSKRDWFCADGERK